MITAQLEVMRASIRTLLLIGVFATVGSGIMVIGVGMDTPWAPWETESDTMFPPVLFTLASFAATVAFCAATVILHTSLKMVTENPDKWWKTSGILFLIAYGTYSFGSGTTEAAMMLNILHLIVGIPALTLLPRVFEKFQYGRQEIN